MQMINQSTKNQCSNKQNYFNFRLDWTKPFSLIWLNKYIQTKSNFDSNDEVCKKYLSQSKPTNPSSCPSNLYMVIM